jgi:hypothetical protein
MLSKMLALRPLALGWTSGPSESRERNSAGAGVQWDWPWRSGERSIAPMTGNRVQVGLDRGNGGQRIPAFRAV